MLVSERDKVAAKALIEVLNKAEFNLKGSEAIIVGKVMEWSAEMAKRIETDLAPKPSIVPAEAPKTEVKEPKAKKSKKEA
jgi:hypothetical protein